MCCCGAPTINGSPGYRWQPTDPPGIRPLAPPTLGPDDVLVYDEPGRCGGLDCHSHHFRVVRRRGRGYLLVRHGGGEEGLEIPVWSALALQRALYDLDTDGRYWILHAIYSAHADARRAGRDAEAARWRTAAAEKRIKVRKVRGQSAVRVTIEEGRDHAR